MRVRDGIYTEAIEWALAEEMGVNRRGAAVPALSVHVAETDEATVLFGAGHESIAGRTASVAREHEVDVVVVEHGDPDHYGGVPRLRSELGLEVAVPAGDAGRLAEAGIESDHRLDGSETFRGVTVIDAPGHTPGNLAFVYDEVLFAGDTVIGADVELVADDDWSGPLALSPPNRNSGGDEAAGRSVGRLLDHAFDVVLLTHGEPVLERGREQVETLVRDLEGGIDRRDRGALE